MGASASSPKIGPLALLFVCEGCAKGWAEIRVMRAEGLGVCSLEVWGSEAFRRLRGYRQTPHPRALVLVRFRYCLSTT